MTRKLMTLIAAAATMTALVFTTTAAARRADPYVSVNPTPAYVGTNLSFSGCGYQANTSVTVVINSPFATSFTGASTGTNGCFSTSNWGYTALMAGSYTANIYQPSDHHKPSGTLTFTVS